MKPTDLDINDYHGILQSLREDSDRASAVLAGSFIENYLAKYLKIFMVEDGSAKLFDSDGPLSTFNQRIRIAYAFKLISIETRNDLFLIAKIRNHFAHHPLHASFDTAPVSDFCRSLSTLSVLPASIDTPDTRASMNRHRMIIAMGKMVATWHRELKPEERNIYIQIFGQLMAGPPAD